VKLAQHLTATVTRHECVHLVYDHEPQISEDRLELVVAIHEEALKALGCGLHDATRLLEKSPLHTCTYTPMPRPHRDVSVGKQGVEPLELVVDERFEGPDV